MFCTNCGNQLSAGVDICPNCGAYVVRPTAVQMPDINNYLVQSVLVTLCCMPLGVVAVYYAAQASSKFAAGDVAGGQAAANIAKLWCWLGFAGGLIVAVSYGLFMGFASLGHH